MTRFTKMLGPSALLLVAATLAAPLAHAKSEAQLRYEQERKACMSGTSNQDRATCLKEAGAALAESKKGNLSGGESQMTRNRLARCSNLPAQDKEDCIQRMQEGSTSGSAQQGGILREASKPVPAR